MLTRRQVLGCVAVSAIGTNAFAQSVEPPSSSSLARGLGWLLSQQADDGGWHSETYGALRSGAATTALAIYALSHIAGDMSSQEIDDSLARGLKFLQPGIAKRGFVACPDGSLDYPTYGTAMLATAARQRAFGLSDEMHQKFVDWVISGQLHESREFTAKSPHYGGWDLMGASQVKGLTSDTNVSCTCFALEAIAGNKSDGAKQARRRALDWAARCHNSSDGGFWFSPDPTSINHKAGFKDDEPTQPKSYATATCDGLRCWEYAFGAADFGDDAPRASALAYLKRADEVQHVPGFETPEEPLGWALGLRFYYYQTLVKTLLASDEEWARDRRAAVAKQLDKLQHKDGRWQNDSPRMREDDPLIATSLALVALSGL